MLKRSLVFSLTIVLVWGIGAQALDLMGPPTAGLDCGNWGFGAAFFASEEDLEIDLGALGFGDVPLNDFDHQRYYGWISYGLTDWVEVYTRLGVIDAEIDDLAFEDSSSFIGSIGTKITFARDQWVDWGFAFQVGWSCIEDSYAGTVDLTDYGLGVVDVGVDFDVNFMELQAAVGPVVKLDGWKIYGGPLFYYFDGELDADVGPIKADFDIEEQSRIGGYGGVIVELASNAALLVEGIFFEDGWGAGVNIGWEF